MGQKHTELVLLGINSGIRSPLRFLIMHNYLSHYTRFFFLDEPVEGKSVNQVDHKDGEPFSAEVYNEDHHCHLIWAHLLLDSRVKVQHEVPGASYKKRK